MRRLALVVVVAALVCTSCGFRGLDLVRDDRVTFVSPSSGDEVTLPLTLRWKVDGDLREAVRFAVFIDRNPMPTGKDVRWLGDRVCKRTPGCPDAVYLAQRSVFLAEGTSLTLETMPSRDRSEHRRLENEAHEATIVPLDAENRRIGEGTAHIEFSVRRHDKGSSE